MLLPMASKDICLENFFSLNLLSFNLSKSNYSLSVFLTCYFNLRSEIYILYLFWPTAIRCYSFMFNALSFTYGRSKWYNTQIIQHCHFFVLFFFILLSYACLNTFPSWSWLLKGCNLCCQKWNLQIEFKSWKRLVMLFNLGKAWIHSPPSYG